MSKEAYKAYTEEIAARPTLYLFECIVEQQSSDHRWIPVVGKQQHSSHDADMTRAIQRCIHGLRFAGIGTAYTGTTEHPDQPGVMLNHQAAVEHSYGGAFVLGVQRQTLSEGSLFRITADRSVVRRIGDNHSLKHSKKGQTHKKIKITFGEMQRLFEEDRQKF